MLDRNHCSGCPLDGLYEHPAEALGDTSAPYMLVSDTPSRNSFMKGMLIATTAMDVLKDGLRSARFATKDFYIAPQIRCPHDPTEFTTKEKRLIQQKCREHLLDDIHEFKPEAVLPMGAEPSRQILGKAVKITKVRGILEHSSELKTKVFPILSPSMVAMYPQHAPIFRSDCETFGRLVDNEYSAKAASDSILGDYTIVDDLEFLIEQEPKLLFFDIEATGLEFFYEGQHNVRDYDPAVHGKEFDPSAAVLTMQFCIEPGKAYMLVWDHPDAPISMRRKPKMLEQLSRLLCNPKTRVVGQNIKFDCNYVWANLGIRFKIGGDTLMLAALLDENALSKSQDTLVKHYVPEMAGYADHFNATVDKSRRWEVPLPKMLDYGCGDVESGYLLYFALMDLVGQDAKLMNHYKRVSLPGLNTFVTVEKRGLGVDDGALDSFESLMETVVAQEEESLLSQVPKGVKRKHIDDGLKFSRSAFVLDILFYHKDGFRLKPKVYTKTTAKLPPDKRVPSTSSKDHLPYFFDECPFTLELAQYMKDSRLLGTNIKGFRKKYIHDGLVRPSYRLDVTVTGRTSSEKPNGQNFPKRGPNAKAYRRIFVPPPGYYVLEADLSQAELRIAADMANDREMLRIYQTGGDIHKATACIALGVTMNAFALLPKDEQKDWRTKAKAINFGFLYGMGWRKFIGYAKTQYGVVFTEQEAQNIREAFFDRYYALPEWHMAMREFAHRNGFVRSYSGRVRHLPMIDSEDQGVQAEAERQAINSPVQEFGSSLGVMALGRLNEEIDHKYLVPIAFVHDAIYCYVPYRYAEWGARTLKHYMQTNPLEKWFNLRMKCPIIADVSLGLNLGDTYELEGFSLDEPYDFSKLWNEEEQKGLRVPTQRIPPNNGRQTGSIYTLPGEYLTKKLR